MQAYALNCMFLVMTYLYITCSARIKVPAHLAHSVPAVFGKETWLAKECVRSDTNAVVCNVYDYFERESKKNKKIHQGIVKLKKKTVDATGLSKRTVEFVIEVGGSSSSEDDHSSDGLSSDSSSVSSDSD